MPIVQSQKKKKVREKFNSKLTRVAISAFEKKQYDAVNSELKRLIQAKSEKVRNNDDGDDEAAVGTFISVMMLYDDLKLFNWIIQHRDAKALEILKANMNYTAKVKIFGYEGNQLLDLLEKEKEKEQNRQNNPELFGQVAEKFFQIFFEVDAETAENVVEICKNKNMKITPLLEKTLVKLKKTMLEEKGNQQGGGGGGDDED